MTPCWSSWTWAQVPAWGRMNKTQQVPPRSETGTWTPSPRHNCWSCLSHTSKDSKNFQSGCFQKHNLCRMWYGFKGASPHSTAGFKEGSSWYRRCEKSAVQGKSSCWGLRPVLAHTQKLQCKKINFQHESCDTVSCDMWTLSLVYDTVLIKPLEMFEWKKYFIVFHNKPLNRIWVFVNEVTLWAPREFQDGTWLPEEPTMWLDSWNFQVDTPSSRDRIGVGDWAYSPTLNDLINNETSIKSPWTVVHKDPQSWTTHPPAGRVAIPHAWGQKLLCLGSIQNSPNVLLHLAIPLYPL